MDHAVALVEAYLRVNGYFTVTEYPVVEACRYGGYRTATDLDILAFRFPHAGRLVLTEGVRSRTEYGLASFEPDPELGGLGEQADMIIGEVKERRAELNQACRDAAVLQAVLTRFGCCEASHVPEVVKALLQKGSAQTHCGHMVRLVVFGSQPPASDSGKYKLISLGHVQQFLEDYIRQHWEVLCHAQFKD